MLLDLLRDISPDYLDALFDEAEHPFENWASSRIALERKNPHNLHGLESDLFYFSPMRLIPLVIGPAFLSILSPKNYIVDEVNCELCARVTLDFLSHSGSIESFFLLKKSDWEELVDCISQLPKGLEVKHSEWVELRETIIEQLKPHEL